MRTEDHKTQRHQTVAMGKRPSEQTLHFMTRMRHLGEVRPPGFWIRLRRPVKERGTDSTFKKRRNRRVGVRRRRIVMTPVDQRGGAAVDLIERADQGGDENV